ncbi:matrix metalloproteinase [Acrasis kona]|uniref:Matrix metalloproteinase n=1 Tax=Acrasis kona TaxID=1008807 RepID=A0AAW2YJM5_9EUKA
MNLNTLEKAQPQQETYNSTFNNVTFNVVRRNLSYNLSELPKQIEETKRTKLSASFKSWEEVTSFDFRQALSQYSPEALKKQWKLLDKSHVCFLVLDNQNHLSIVIFNYINKVVVQEHKMDEAVIAFIDSHFHLEVLDEQHVMVRVECASVYYKEIYNWQRDVVVECSPYWKEHEYSIWKNGAANVVYYTIGWFLILTTPEEVVVECPFSKIITNYIYPKTPFSIMSLPQSTPDELTNYKPKNEVDLLPNGLFLVYSPKRVTLLDLCRQTVVYTSERTEQIFVIDCGHVMMDGERKLTLEGGDGVWNNFKKRYGMLWTTPLNEQYWISTMPDMSLFLMMLNPGGQQDAVVPKSSVVDNDGNYYGTIGDKQVVSVSVDLKNETLAILELLDAGTRPPVYGIAARWAPNIGTNYSIRVYDISQKTN